MERFYRNEPPTAKELARLRAVSVPVNGLVAETCFCVDAGLSLDSGEREKLQYLLDARFADGYIGDEGVLEIGPRLTFETPLSSTLRAVCARMGVAHVGRLERMRRYRFGEKLSSGQWTAAAAALHDHMTQMVYDQPLSSFASTAIPELTQVIPVCEEGIDALVRANRELIGGLGMTDATVRWMYDLFAVQLRRDPTDVEVATLAQANSEHCRHQTMRGKVVIDGAPMGYSLFDVFMAPHRSNPNNSVIAFHDDASAIRGGQVQVVVVDPQTREYKLAQLTLHPTNTAETHNGPTEIGAYPGAATGAGGEIRDSMVVGQGAVVSAGGMGICVANLRIPGYPLPWEDDDVRQRDGLPSTLDVLVEGSNGAFDYGNCFGRPVITGHAASFGLYLPDGSYHGWGKPVLYSQGVGEIRDEHLVKSPPEKGMLVVQIGGPAYPIGIGGGTFSSKLPDSAVSTGDLNAIQRPDPATERALYNVFRRCVELGPNNPIESSHDLGAGGSANALPEILGQAGGRIAVKSLPVGDTGMSVLQIFVCEAQERNVVLVRTENWPALKEIAVRESVVAMVVGAVIGNGEVVLFDANSAPDAPDHLQSPVHLPVTAFDGSGVIEPVHFTRQDRGLEPLHLPRGLPVLEALQRVFRLMTVGSKHFLVDKVDRSVGGRVAQQQCVGPFHLPLCGYGLTAYSLTGHYGTAFAHGERHRLGFISPVAQARMSVVEMLQKLMSVVITDLTDIRFSGNWMWPPLAEGGNGARLHDAAVALSEMCVGLGIAEDGGKDSIFMRTFDNKGRLVVSPGQLVLAPYVTVADVRRRVTPELKEEGNSLILVDLSDGNARLGGSALAQVYGQVGDHCPDIASSKLIKQAFVAVQEMVARGEVVSLHGRSDGGLITTLVEMAIAGGHGIDVRLDSAHEAVPALFNEEAGVVIETAQPGLAQMTLERFGVPCQVIGKVQGRHDPVQIRHNGTSVLYEILEVLRSLWSETSSRIDETQSNPAPIRAERQQLSRTQRWPDWHLTYTPSPSFRRRGQAKVAVLRAPATNGEYEMAQAAQTVGFRVVDVTVEDLAAGRADLRSCQGLLLPGGFSYGDIPDAASAQAAVMRFNPAVAKQLAAFRERPDTFAFGTCNGAQLMLKMGWAPGGSLPQTMWPRFARNKVERHKSSFVTVEILPSQSLMFKGMEGSRLGVWVSHGEGRLEADDSVLSLMDEQQLVPMRYVTPDGDPTEANDYPYNPSGTPHGWPAVCSADGRFTAVMPHPERMANQLWQWPWLPSDWKEFTASPWLLPFQNAYDWCTKG